ncbi:hypothetical protein CJ030_MR5G017142 [Morella rubra]|uniref:Zinc knuckle CX2CX4HX4C domain-containing protein n=1 Tax=Morella rubra TaxID=262757 RepID=A0A6A1VLU0_9ROSI|nr:hypothetical protein CJ030_MR5G017142 [Morella rubra]
MGLSTAWVQFKYEKLADFCYVCGRIGQTQSSCRPAASYTGKLPFDYKMRATSSSLRWDSVDRVMQPPHHELKCDKIISPASSLSKSSSTGGWHSLELPSRKGHNVVVGTALDLRASSMVDISGGTSPLFSSLVIEDPLLSLKSPALSSTMGTDFLQKAPSALLGRESPLGLAFPNMGAFEDVSPASGQRVLAFSSLAAKVQNVTGFVKKRASAQLAYRGGPKLPSSIEAKGKQVVDSCPIGVASKFGLGFAPNPFGIPLSGFVSDLLSIHTEVISPVVSLRTPKRKLSSPLLEEFSPKRGVSLNHSTIRYLGSVRATQEIDTSELEEHLTLAVLKAHRFKIAL